jgi:hypothetical protein
VLSKECPEVPKSKSKIGRQRQYRDRQPCLKGYIQRKGNRITGVANVKPAMTFSTESISNSNSTGRRCRSTSYPQIEDAQRDSAQVKRPHPDKKGSGAQRAGHTRGAAIIHSARSTASSARRPVPPSAPSNWRPDWLKQASSTLPPSLVRGQFSKRKLRPNPSPAQ